MAIARGLRPLARRRNYKRLSPAVLRRLLACYDSASPAQRYSGMTWYATANVLAGDLARRHGVTLEAACGCIAALSPGLTWEVNVSQADTLVDAWKRGARGRSLPLLGVYGRAAIDKCERILGGVDPLAVLREKTGPKVNAFYRCLVDPANVDVVCVDRHAASAALGRRGTRGGSAVTIVPLALYRWLAWHYRTLAERVGVSPLQLQAVCWVVQRVSTPGHRVDEVNECPF